MRFPETMGENVTEMVSRLNEIEAIKQLKFTYLRALDLNRWDLLAECLTEDVSCWYDSGNYKREGRSEVLEFLRGTSLARPENSSLHLASHPVITLQSPTRASGTWALSDTVIDRTKQTLLRGAAYYEDEYAKVGGHWKIRSTGYDRLYELRDPLV